MNNEVVLFFTFPLVNPAEKRLLSLQKLMLLHEILVISTILNQAQPHIGLIVDIKAELE